MYLFDQGDLNFSQRRYTRRNEPTLPERISVAIVVTSKIVLSTLIVRMYAQWLIDVAVEVICKVRAEVGKRLYVLLDSGRRQSA